eukprot:8195900-Pyramimonas_sp.AAC.1
MALLIPMSRRGISGRIDAGSVVMDAWPGIAALRGGVVRFSLGHVSRPGMRDCKFHRRDSCVRIPSA